MYQRAASTMSMVDSSILISGGKVNYTDTDTRGWVHMVVGASDIF